MTPNGIRTHNLSSRAATDLRPRPRGHWDRLTETLIITKTNKDMQRLNVRWLKVAKSGVNTQAFVQYNTTYRYFTR